MKLNIRKIQDKETVTIDGSEGWLAEIYRDYPAARTDDGVTSLLKATLTVEAEGFHRATVRGTVSYSPALSCSRCGEPVSWTIAAPVEAYFTHPAREVVRDRLLSNADLDKYEMDGGEIDIGAVVNDIVALGIPSQVFCEAAAGRECQALANGAAEDSSLVYSDETEDEPVERRESPFAVLQALRKDKEFHQVVEMVDKAGLGGPAKNKQTTAFEGMPTGQ